MEESNFNELMPQKLPNAIAVLVLGILSVLTCCCYGIGLVLAIIALVLAGKDMKLYRANPQAYTNYSNLNIGRILAYIGLALNVIYLIMLVWMIATFGWEGMQDQELVQQHEGNDGAIIPDYP